MKIIVKAYAKVNLLLDLTAVLENGYHSIYTVMQSIGIYDTVTVEDTDSNKIELSCSDKNIPVTSSNTAWKSAVAFFDFTGIPFCGLKINIDKVIPSEAGMAGGSADAAAVIKALDAIYNTQLSESDLCMIGEKVGSDVPFCIVGGTKLCLNKGEVMAPLPDFPKCHILVVKPSQGVSTKEAYKNFDDANQIRHPDNEGFIYAATQKDLRTMCFKAANVFEQVVEVPDRVKIKAIMRNHNALLTMMTGSGAAVFGVFEKKADANVCFNELKNTFENVYITNPLHIGLQIISD